MADFSPPQTTVTPLHISSLSRYGVAWESRMIHSSSGPGAVTWVANLAAYIPLTLPFPYPVRRVWWVNGSTVTSTNVDMGVYTLGGQKLFSAGSTAMGSAGAMQYVSLATDVLLMPGTYYLAWTCSNTTSRANATDSDANDGRMMGLLEETSALPLPATMTPVAWTRAFGSPHCGITRTSTGF